MAEIRDEFPGDAFQGDIDYLNSGYDAGRPAEIRFLENLLALGGGAGMAQLGALSPKLAKGAYGFLKGLGNAGKIGVEAAPEAVSSAKAVNQGLQALTVPDELAEVQAVLQGAGKTASESVVPFIKGFQKGLKGEEIPIYGVKGPADRLKALFGDVDPGSVPENVLIAKGLLPGVAQKGMATDIAAQKTLNLVEDAGGATFNLSKGSLANTPHYAVSIYPERELILSAEPTSAQIEAYIMKNQDLLTDAKNSIGVWKDVESGKTYLDIAVTLPNKTEAMELGAKHGQKAIFDLQNMKEIRLKKLGGKRGE